MHQSVPVIMVTGNGNIEDAKHALRASAFDYVAKPFLNSEIVNILKRALEKRSRKFFKSEQVNSVPAESELLESMGFSSSIQQIVKSKAKVSSTNFAVLVIGETGTGKELVSRAIHDESGRSAKPFVAVDCGAIPESLIESELFGHEKGSFTGATGVKIGAFEAAAGGTIFLDEIGNLPYSVQGKLLRVLETRRVRRVGCTQERPVDFRVVAATNNDLKHVDPQHFRLDLYHRLAEFTIEIPPLRDRREDLEYLVNRFLKLANLELSKDVTELTPESWDLINGYSWPGNVRELRNEIRRAVLLCQDNDPIGTQQLSNLVSERALPIKSIETQSHAISMGHVMELSQSLHEMNPAQTPYDMEFSCRLSTRGITALLALEGGLHLTAVMGKAMSEIERGILIQVLKIAEGNKAHAARLLHIDYKTMHGKLKKIPD
jgi:two-component system nitrogen regulation response regulator GlnG